MDENYQTSHPHVYVIGDVIGGFTSASAALQEEGLEINIAKSPLAGNGKALAIGETEGYIKLISDKEYGELLGGVVVAPNATDLIPSISEGFWEAANSNWN